MRSKSRKRLAMAALLIGGRAARANSRSVRVGKAIRNRAASRNAGDIFGARTVASARNAASRWRAADAAARAAFAVSELTVRRIEFLV